MAINYRLRPDQEKVLAELSQGLGNHRRVLVQAATGFGKTVVFSSFIKSLPSNARVVIFVHKTELAKQAQEKISEWAGVRAGVVYSSVKRINPDVRVIISMVDTGFNRLKRKPTFFGSRDYVIIDECHRADFRKIYGYFPDAKIIGFSATPISSSPKHPLNLDFDKIICGPSNDYLISVGALARNRTRVNAKAKRDSVKMVRNEFATKEASEEFSTDPNLLHALDVYKNNIHPRKTLIFNVDISHSQKMDAIFKASGINSMHIDGGIKGPDREKILKWFSSTPDAVLQNVGVLTTGYDEPSICDIVLNLFTNSLPLFLQMTGRGSRPFSGKEYFNIWDLGGNAWVHMDWNYPHDWKKIFESAKLSSPRGDGVAPMKECKQCGSFIPVHAMECDFCGYAYPHKIREYDTEEIVLVDFPSDHEVERITLEARVNGYNPFWEVHQIADIVANRISSGADDVESKDYYMLQMSAWCDRNNREFSPSFVDSAQKILSSKIKHSNA